MCDSDLPAIPVITDRGNPKLVFRTFRVLNLRSPSGTYGKEDVSAAPVRGPG